MRIRSIKPEFWRSEDIAALDLDTRLLFIGLWSYVDDNGVGRDVEALIVADLFALDDPTESLARVSRGLRKLSEGGQITRYTVGNRRYLHVGRWRDHQKIDHPNKDRYPLPTCDDAEFASVSRDSREDVAPGAVEQWSSGAVEQIKKRAAKPHSYSSEFELFWKRYPKKAGKDAAAKAWKSAIKRATVDEITQGAERYAADPNRDPTYTMNPATWLNGGNWGNDPLPPRINTTRPHPSVTNGSRPGIPGVGMTMQI